MITVEIVAPSGLSSGPTLTAALFAVNSDVVVRDSVGVVIEQGNVKGAYLATFDAPVPNRPYLVVLYNGTNAVAAAYTFPVETTGTYRSGFYADVLAASTAEILLRIARNKTVTDPVTGTLIVYGDDDVTPMLTAPLFEDVAETQPYRKRGAEVRGRLVP